MKQNVYFFVFLLLQTTAISSTVCALPPITISISSGELVDKITILEIKSERITDTQKLKNIYTELNLLMIVFNALPQTTLLNQLKIMLKEINIILWDIEDQIRAKEFCKSFDDSFIQLARSVYKTNDKRYALKCAINKEIPCGLTEEKLYSSY